MCRLYGFCANEPTKVECTLVHAQNALVAQSRSDLSGKTHSEGWGVVTFDDVGPQVERQAWAAYHGEHFHRAASRIYADIVIAHVRRATVGGAEINNTHPFVSGKWAFAHNGTVRNFDRVKKKILSEIAPDLKSSIKGQTDSEHIFYYVLSLIRREGASDLRAIIAQTIGDVDAWAREVDPKSVSGLNIILTDGDRIAGSRFGRTLHYVERDGVYDCEICGFPHIHHEQATRYRAFVVASEPLTHENWLEIPNRSLWEGAVSRPEISIRSF